ncbi:unnamed protein product [Sphenostylis stenocarpa]|uniref:Uncharacterized protein n=1 Tax=Sphenostylis stenocarpa TaxID=92480 RepID=A0AA86T168_9FABA|nr:unnamed protein product [Sphenostylis stenocarpa]
MQPLRDEDILSAYFVVLPLRDEGAISLGLSNLPGLFAGSLVLTLIAAPFSSLIFSLPNLSKGKVALLNLITISSTWARVIDVMDSEDLLNILRVQSGSRLFGFIGAGATLGQLFGSLFAIGMAFVGPCEYAVSLIASANIESVEEVHTCHWPRA